MPSFITDKVLALGGNMSARYHTWYGMIYRGGLLKHNIETKKSHPSSCENHENVATDPRAIPPQKMLLKNKKLFRPQIF